MLNEKSVLITGGTGSFGKKFVETILRDYPQVKRIVIYSSFDLKFDSNNSFKALCLSIKSSSALNLDLLKEYGCALIWIWDKGKISIISFTKSLKVIPFKSKHLALYRT